MHLKNTIFRRNACHQRFIEGMQSNVQYKRSRIILAGLATYDPKFPINGWYPLLPQAEITLNLLRQARRNTKQSAYSYLFGPYNYNKSHMLPPGTKFIVHKKPSNLLSWGYHGVEGWYVGPKMDHYRC